MRLGSASWREFALHELFCLIHRVEQLHSIVECFLFLFVAHGREVCLELSLHLLLRFFALLHSQLLLLLFLFEGSRREVVLTRLHAAVSLAFVSCPLYKFDVFLELEGTLGVDIREALVYLLQFVLHRHVVFVAKGHLVHQVGHVSCVRCFLLHKNCPITELLSPFCGRCWVVRHHRNELIMASTLTRGLPSRTEVNFGQHPIREAQGRPFPLERHALHDCVLRAGVVLQKFGVDFRTWWDTI